ncbi:MAG TPA: thiamine pyrophosphate-binding protein [Allosphingosinicella sp.]
MRVFEAIVAMLEEVGVDVMFGGAGENASGLMIALKHAKSARGIITKHEQNASFMACGYAMFSGKLGVCFSTAGPGAFNLISGLCVALVDSYPVLAITGYSTIGWDGRGSANETSGLNRTPDSRKLFDAVVKKDPTTGEPANYLITRVEDVVPTFQKALEIALTGRPGSVHIAIAEELTYKSVKVPNYSPPKIDMTPPAPEPAQVEAAAALLAGTIKEGKNVVLLAGYGAVRANAGAEVRAFVERYQVPVVTTMDGKGVLDEDHPLALGLFCDSGHKSAWEVFLDADAVLAVGNSFSQHATFDFRDDLFENRKLVQINIDEVDTARFYKADVAVVGDAKVAMAMLNKAMEGRAGPVARKSFRAPDFDRQRVIDVTPKLHPGRVVQAVSRMLPDRGIVLADAGAHMAWAAYYLELKDGQNFRKPGSFGPMALGVCGAMGAKCAEPERTVVALVGDGCYLMSGLELMTAVEHKIPVIWVIFNDGELRLIKLYQLATFQETALIEFDNPDYVALARACGADGYAVNRQSEFEDAFADALASGRPTLIDAKISRLELPHFSTNPEGVLAGIFERVRERLGA